MVFSNISQMVVLKKTNFQNLKYKDSTERYLKLIIIVFFKTCLAKFEKPCFKQKKGIRISLCILKQQQHTQLFNFVDFKKNMYSALSNYKLIFKYFNIYLRVDHTTSAINHAHVYQKPSQGKSETFVFTNC